MTDNLRRYRAISDYLKQIYPNATGHQVHYGVAHAMEHKSAVAKDLNSKSSFVSKYCHLL